MDVGKHLQANGICVIAGAPTVSPASLDMGERKEVHVRPSPKTTRRRVIFSSSVAADSLPQIRVLVNY